MVGRDRQAFDIGRRAPGSLVTGREQLAAEQRAIDAKVIASWDDLSVPPRRNGNRAARRPEATANSYAPPPAELVTVRASDVRATPVHWLWPGYLPVGKLVMFEGLPGRGKTTVTLDWAARISTGRPLPGGSEVSTRRAVVFVTFEDGLADTLVPRLKAAGADLSLVRFIQGARLPDGSTDTFTLGSHTGALVQLVKALDAALVVIDPIVAALDSKTNSYKDAEVRRALAPLSAMADETGATVVAIRHPVKGATARAMTAGGGSIAFIAAARVGLVLGDDPEDEESGRILAVVKNNLSAPVPSLRLAIAERVVETDCGEASAPVIEWRGVSTLTADDVNAQRSDMAGADAPNEVEAWLADVLASGPMLSRDVLRLGRETGFAERTIHRVRKRLGVTFEQSGLGKEKRSLWALPVTDATAETPNHANRATVSHVDTNGRNGTNGPATKLMLRSDDDRGDDMGAVA